MLLEETQPKICREQTMINIDILNLMVLQRLTISQLDIQYNAKLNRVYVPILAESQIWIDDVIITQIKYRKSIFF